MAEPTSIRFPDDLRARVEESLGPREKFSAGVLRLVEQGLARESSSFSQARREPPAGVGKRTYAADPK